MKDVKILKKPLNEYNKLAVETKNGTTQYRERLKQGFPEGHDPSYLMENYTNFIQSKKLQLEKLHEKIIESII